MPNIVKHKNNNLMTQNFPTLFNYLFDNNYDRDINIDVYEYEDKIKLVADILGFNKDDIKVEFENGYLYLRGEKKKEKEDESAKVLYREITNRSFARKFRLGDSFDQENIEATIKDNMLTIILPKSEKGKYRNIEIKE